jgi:hypothetical protein
MSRVRGQWILSDSRCLTSDPGETGGADRDRTDDPLLAKQVLSQLSYSPVWPTDP